MTKKKASQPNTASSRSSTTLVSPSHVEPNSTPVNLSPLVPEKMVVAAAAPLVPVKIIIAATPPAKLHEPTRNLRDESSRNLRPRNLDARETVSSILGAISKSYNPWLRFDSCYLISPTSFSHRIRQCNLDHHFEFPGRSLSARNGLSARCRYINVQFSMS